MEMMQQMTALPSCKIRDQRLAEWLRSSPVANPYTVETEVILIFYEAGMFRWPVVPVQDVVSWK